MKPTVLIAPDSFKDCLSAAEVTEALAQGINGCAGVNIIKMPLADGGEGTVEALVNATGGSIIETEVVGPLATPIKACWGVLGVGNTAVIEMAAASGLMLVPPELRNPGITTTFGTGQLIAEALNRGCKDIIIGIGGSATNDGGLGVAQALGVSVKDCDGNELGYGGTELHKAAKIDTSGLHPGLAEANIKVACDVTNPLFGKQGAAYVYGPQKGAGPELVRILDDNLCHWARVIEGHFKRQVSNIPGAGAAGGVGAGLMVFAMAELVSGIELVMDTLAMDQVLCDVDLVVTGEGRFDAQTASGKVAAGLAARAKKMGIPVVVVAGSVCMWREAPALGIDAVLSICKEPMEFQDSVKNARELLVYTGAQIGGLAKALLK